MDVATLFDQTYGRRPQRCVLAPGRVNLIGEHLDYALLPVLPVALQFGVQVAASVSANGRIRAVSDGQADLLDIPSDLAIPPSGWGRYVWSACREAGVQGVDLAISSDLFADGGLSSSSALTVGLLGAISDLAGEELVRAASRAERSVGIEGGLMDQTVIVAASPGSALRIEFDPWSYRPVPIPPGISFVAAHSGARAAKTDAVRDAFDARVSGGRIASSLVARALGADAGIPPLLGRVANHRGIDDAIAGLPISMAAREAPAPLADLVQFTARSLDPDALVPVRAVAGHVISESRRVDRVVGALAAGDVRSVGAALDESHRSLQRFGATTRRLDAVCQAMRAAGALGARMTGAGWGGFAVAACEPADVAAVVHAAIASGGGPAFEVVASAGMQA